MSTYKMVMLEPVRSCPVKCLPCPIGREVIHKHPVAVLDLSMAQKCFTKLRKQFGSTHLVLGNWGEPLLHPNFCELVKMAKQEGFENVYVTTSLSVDRNMLDIISCGLDTIHISISGLTESVYRQSHRHGNFDLIMKNILDLARLREMQASAPEIAIRWHRYRHNEFQIEAAQKLFNDLGLGFYPYFAHSGAYEALRDWSNNSLEQPLKDFVEHSVFTDFVEQACRLNQGATECQQSSFLIIDADGSMLFCCSCYENYKPSIPFLEMVPEEVAEFKRPNSSVCAQCLAKGWAGYLIRPKTLKEYNGQICMPDSVKDI